MSSRILNSDPLLQYGWLRVAVEGIHRHRGFQLAERCLDLPERAV
jgi:hypothetical protein